MYQYMIQGAEISRKRHKLHSSSYFVTPKDISCHTSCRENFFQEGLYLIYLIRLKTTKSETHRVNLEMRTQDRGC